MQNSFVNIVFVFFLLCFIQLASPAQQPGGQVNQNDAWIRVQSDNGEFSIEIPAKYKLYNNEDGFSVSNSNKNFRLTNMNMVNAYVSGTFVSFETYKAAKGALNSIYESDSSGRIASRRSELELSGIKVKQIVQESEKTYSVRRYFNTKQYIYVLTAASRNGETEEIRRFLESFVLRPNTKDGPLPNAVPLSTLTFTDIAVQTDLAGNSPEPSGKLNSAGANKEDGVTPLAIINKQRVSYVDAAREKRVVGTIRLKVTFAEDGYIPKIVVVRTLPEGLLRQALFSALRIKFLPKLKDDVPITTVYTIEYSFSIY